MAFGRMGARGGFGSLGVLGRVSGLVPNYFVSPTGSDVADGRTLATAWQTITKVNSSTFLPGDVIGFQGGQTFTGPLNIPSSGSVVARIAFTSYGLGRATISSAANTHGIFLQNKQYVTVDGINLVGSSASQGANTGTGFYASSTDTGTTKFNGVSLKNSDISLFGHGVYVANDATLNTGSSGFSNFLCDSCVIHNNGNGFETYSNSTTSGRCHANVTVSNTRCNDNAAVGTSSGTGNIVLGGVNVALVTNCTSYNYGAVTTFNGEGIWTYDSDSVVIQLSESYNNKTNSGNDGGGFGIDQGCQSCILQFCYSHGNQGPGFLFDTGTVTAAAFSNNTIRYCISEGESNLAFDGAITIANDANAVMTNNHVYNNTIYANDASPANCLHITANASAATGVVANNIFYASGTSMLTEVDTTTAYTFAGNEYFSEGTPTWKWNGVTYTSFASWQTATGQEKISGANVGFNVDPKLFAAGLGGTLDGLTPKLAAYNLQVGSPMIAVGLNLAAQFGITNAARDYYGNAVSASAPPIGAYSGAGLSVSPLWSPLNDAGLVDWFDSTDPASVTLNGTKIASWTGRSKALTAVQATAANQPVYTGTAINGVQALAFAGSPVSIKTAAFKHPATWTMVAVGKASGAAIQSLVDADKYDATKNEQAQYLRNNAGTLESVAYNTVPALFIGSKTGMGSSAAVIGAQHLATSITATLNGSDGTPTTTTGTNASATIGLNFGVASAGTPAQYLIGQIGDVIFSATITTSIKQKMEGYLAWKYGLQASLPGGHPYASRAPLLNDP